ncbi:PhnA domain-containing protein [Vibrio tapetis]|uniref:Putative alkylphosphonate uptake protein n=1 Tax=Vibrio tapetis subsp. tapetis TaxID=1671868 RepID=A0A2N8ZMV8_9VIBR|nr:PhnA domain-containing protein [Vibrio tapetis]SON53253.1 putative alkylphosphonate uptake protein [Vibrio tapetis subsp. tapetis]
MSTETTLLNRCGSKCELCSAETSLTPFVVPPHSHLTVDHGMMVCDKCMSEIDDPQDVNHWRCLNDSMWSQEPPVQVTAWRQLTRLSAETWAQDLLEMMYLEEETSNWAQIGMSADDKPLDINGVELKKGDDVTVTKDLPVKGTNQVIKQGTVIRGISIGDDPKLVSGKANGGQSMYVIAEFCRKK